MLVASISIPNISSYVTESHRTAVSGRLMVLQDTLLNQQRQKRWGEILPGIGTAWLAVMTPLIVISPYLSKKVVPGLLKSNYQWLKRPAAQKKLHHFLDKNNLLKTLIKIGLVGDLLMYINQFKTGFNTRQPSKIWGKSINVLYAILTFFYPINFFLRSMSIAALGLWQAGSCNDFENYNHLAKRRELQGGLKENFFSKQAVHFVLDDLRHSLSIRPWQELGTYVRKKQFNRPESAISAISSQFNFAAALMGFTSFLTRSAKVKQILLERTVPPLLFCAALLASVPDAFRAWQSRKELDGRLTLTGIPIYIVGRIFTLSQHRYHLSGLNTLGGAVFMQNGTYVTSKKHNFLLQYLNSLYQVSLQDPTLTPRDVRSFLNTHPDQLYQLKKQMGQVRVDFLMETLIESERQLQTTPIAFSTILRNIVTSHDQHLAHSQSSQPHRD